MCEFPAYIWKKQRAEAVTRYTRRNAVAAWAASPVSATAKKSTITPDPALWSGNWTWPKRFLPVLCSGCWWIQEIWSACKSSCKICLVQFPISVNSWFQASWGSPHKCVQHLGSEEFAQNGQFRSSQPGEIGLPASSEPSSFPPWGSGSWTSLQGHSWRTENLASPCSHLAFLLMIASSLLLKLRSLRQASSMCLY